MKRFLSLMAIAVGSLLFSAPVHAQWIEHPSPKVWYGDAPPGRCTPGDFFVSSTQVKMCNQAGTAATLVYTVDDPPSGGSFATNPANCSAGQLAAGITALGVAEGCQPVAQQYFGTSAPGSVAGNLPGARFSDTTNHIEYYCDAPSGTAAPACTSVMIGGWTSPGSTPGLSWDPSTKILTLNGGSADGAGILITSTDDNPSLIIKATGGVNPIPGIIFSINNTRDWRLYLAGNDNEQMSWQHDGTGLAELSTGGIFKPRSYATWANCSDPTNSAGAADCGAAPSGVFVIDAGTTSTIVNTTAVGTNSRVFFLATSAAAVGTALGVTCNTQSLLVLGTPFESARTSGVSTTASINVAPTSNPLCVQFWIVNF